MQRNYSEGDRLTQMAQQVRYLHVLCHSSIRRNPRARLGGPTQALQDFEPIHFRLQRSVV